MDNKIIKASAGTGKTYRLSLEYIGLLLKYHQYDLSYQEILVITFTKKATAEIRERIFAHLQAIVHNKPEAAELCSNLESSLGMQITPAMRQVLEKYYHEMLLNKNLVKINTIDSFINEIFKTIIAPYLGITDYKIDDNIPAQVYAEIFRALLEDEKNSTVFYSFFRRATRKKITDYENLLRSLLDKRWIFDLIEKSAAAPASPQMLETNAEKNLVEFKKAMTSLLQRFQARVMVDYPAMPAADMFKAGFFGDHFSQFDSLQTLDLAGELDKLLTPENLHKHSGNILAGDYFWHGGKVFRKKDNKEFGAELSAEYSAAKKYLADYIFYAELLPETAEINTIARLVYNKYDEIKFRDKIFTHNDISYYCFHYLYDPELSLIDDNFVTNAFYEYLSASIRFVLIDEFQDTGMIQFKILLPIINEVTSGIGAQDYGGVIIVGDEKQSIYGWRGGERELLLKMPGLLPDNRQLSLDTSYRSAPVLIDFINEVFTNPLLQSRLTDLFWPYEKIRAAKKAANACIQVHAKNFYTPRDAENGSAHSRQQYRDFVQEMLLPLLREKSIDVHKTAILARKNSDLKNIAAILNEMGIDYILESSGSVLAHRAIKPLFYLLNYFVYQDLADLVKFFRSDLVLMPPEELKVILDFHRRRKSDNYTVNELFTALQDIPAVEKLHTFINSLCSGKDQELPAFSRFDPLVLVSAVIKEYNVPKLFSQENDLVNINLFLEIVAELLVANHNYPKTLQGLLDYCRDNAASERFQQLGLDQVDAITLLTIHKAKGLEFDSVLLYWDLAAGFGGPLNDINVHLHYREDFTGLAAHVINLNYEHIMQWCSFSDLKTASQNRLVIEELNNIYVALTRAKYNLYMFFAFKKKDGLELLRQELQKEEPPEIDQFLLFSVLDIFAAQNALHTSTNDECHGMIGAPARLDELAAPPARQDYTFIKKYLDFALTHYPSVEIKSKEITEYPDYTSVYIKSRDIDKGNIIHYFLSFIRFGTEQELALAKIQTINYYGNLLPVAEIAALLDRVTTFIDNNRPLLFAAKWQQIYTEITLFNDSGEQFRLDRLMIDKQNHDILIIDYKTGGRHEQQQMDEYIRLVKNLPVVMQKNYKVLGKFVEIPLY
ncbi:MAG TPA: UvrD-helicase domain-containing protein [bacterium]|nr:UvrD-helicase domain-containing protein [bacterium]HPN45020.1 UvrD-helicase domain-containing protein [bacterium]